MRFKSLFILPLLFLFACSENENSTNSFEKEIRFSITEMTDQQYPDNPDIGYRSSKYGVGYFKEGAVVPKTSGKYDLIFYTQKSHNDTITFTDFELMEYIPTIPDNLKDDEYLAYLTIINQEWNRNQVKFNTEEFKCNNPEITRVDVARNCLNAYLWEVIAYTKENGKELPIYHGWFDFPKPLYAQLFKEKNGLPIDRFIKGLEDWKDPKHYTVRRNLLRKQFEPLSIDFVDKSDEMYPVKGERERKFREIVTPVKFNSMRDLQSDLTTFATFSQPGFYNRADPRTTELGRFYNLIDAKMNKIIASADGKDHYEIELQFKDKEGKRATNLVFGGLDLNEFPVLEPANANDGWKTSMGFSNHTFYENCSLHKSCKTETNPYYGFLTDGKGLWLDSHHVGIDGPLIHRDANNPNIIHLWLLSFERHALVGHYVLTIEEKK